MKCIMMLLTLTFVSCHVSINSGEECLECTYKHDGNRRTEKICDDLGTEAQMEAMRDRMQMEADSLNVTLKCERS